MQDEHEQLHYYMDLKQYMPPVNQLRFIGSVGAIQAKDSHVMPAFTHMKKYKTRVIHPDGFLQQSTLMRKEDGYGPKDLPTSTEAQFSRLTRRTNKFGSSFATVADFWSVVNVKRLNWGSIGEMWESSTPFCPN